MNSKNSKTREPHKVRQDLTDKINLSDSERYDLSQFGYLLYLDKHQVRIQQQ